MRSISAVALLLALLLAAADAAGQSLYRKDQRIALVAEKPVNTSILSDHVKVPRQFAKHDLVTVLISEETIGNNRIDTNVQKTTELEWELNSFVRFLRKNAGNLKLQATNTTPKIAFEAEYLRRGIGSTRRLHTLTARITAQVIKVLPNRNLVIEARKVRHMYGETETMTLTGIIRPEDVDSKKNTIQSERIASLAISYSGKGTMTNAHKPGWLMRLVEYLYPF